MWAYRVLLRLYPTSFRAEYGGEMCAVFARRRRDAKGPLAILVLWAGALFEALFHATAVHLDILRQDLRYAARTLGRSPGFAMTAILVAALGIGATTAAFTMVDHVLVRPFPFADPDRLVKFWEDHPTQGSSRVELSPPNYRDWKRMSKSFAAFAAYRGLTGNLHGKGDPQYTEGASLTAEMLSMLGVQPLLGRVFTAEDDRDGAPGTLLLSYGLWQDTFGGDADVLGQTILMEGQPYTVIGVMPQSFYFPDRQARMWTAMRFTPHDFDDRLNNYLYGIASLKPGVSLEQAQAEMRTVTGQLAAAFPRELAHTGATVIRWRDELSPQSRLMLKALLGAAICVLLIACTNLANLLLARAMMRRRELSLRAAMGAGRERLVRQMLTESLILALLGGALGVLIASSALPLLVRLVPVSLPIAEVPTVDFRVLLFAIVLTCATGIGFGVIPALRVGRGADANGLREGAREGGGRRERLRSVLVIAEVAGCLALLVSSGLLIRALWRVRATDLGFRTDHILTLRTFLPSSKYQTPAPREQFYTQVLAGARQIPGVQGAAYTSFLPFVMRGGLLPVEIHGRPQDLANRERAALRFVTPGFFPLLGIPLRLGRGIAESDTRDAPWVAVVSQSFADHYWPGQNPLGRHFDFGYADRMVVGVVGDIHYRSLENIGPPQVYLPHRQVTDGGLPWYAPKDFVVRASGSVEALAPALRRIIHEADPEQPVSDIRPLADIVDAETGARSVQLWALGAFAAVAFLLAGIGLHGLLSFAVSQRTQEIGVRVALGARPGDILGMVLRQGLLMSAVGMVVGVAVGYMAGSAMQALLAGVTPADSVTFAAALGLTLAMTIAGSAAPAIRAVRVDPLTAIRAE
jgi:predicted permease